MTIIEVFGIGPAA